MKAYHIEMVKASKGGVLSLVNMRRPDCGAGEVRIKVRACGLNRADVFQRQGAYPPPLGASNVPGLEVSGTIEVLGSAVSGFKEGQQVCALLEGGGYAEYVAVRATQVLPVPKGLSDIEAAVLPEAFFTVWYNVFQKAHLKSNEVLLVHGGSSGIGVAAIAICQLLGIRCIVTTTHEKKVDALKELGASEVVIAAKSGSMALQVKALTEGKGVDVILDMVAGEYTSQNIKMLRYGGRLAIIALLQGANVEVGLGSVLFKNLTIAGTTLRNQSAEIKAFIAKELQQKVWPLIQKKEYRPEIDCVFSFEEAQAAQEYMEENRHIGKIVLQL